MYCDYHFHTCFSSDSDAPVEAQIERAIFLGMPQICITDHQDFDFPPGEMTFQCRSGTRGSCPPHPSGCPAHDPANP